VLLASRLPFWRQALLIVQPATLLRWHRDAFRLTWRWRSQARTMTARPKIADETIALIKEMAAANPLWGAERLRGELLTLDIRVAKTTVQRYMRQARLPHRRGQSRATFLHNHAHAIWAADFLPVTDLLFRPLYAFFVVELATRRVVHVGVTRHPTDAWVAQQLREATPEGHTPRHLICDHDSKYGPAFARVATASGIDLVRTAYRAPKMNAICERFLGSVRRECLDYLLIVGERHLARVLKEYVCYFNADRPHQGIKQRVPDEVCQPRPRGAGGGAVLERPVLGGLHHTYRRAA
jgi:putative transposase